MTYSRPPFPRQLYTRFKKIAEKCGFTKRGEKWVFLSKLLDFVEENTSLFKRR